MAITKNDLKKEIEFLLIKLMQFTIISEILWSVSFPTYQVAF